MDAVRRIDAYLHDVRRRRLLERAVGGTTAFLAAMALALLLITLLLSVLPSLRGYRLIATLLLATAGGWFVLRLVAAAREVCRRADLARFVGAKRPDLRGDLLSVVELADRPGASFSPALLQALAQQTWAQLRREGPSALVPRDLLRTGAILAAAAVVAWAVAGTLFPERLRRGSELFVAASVAPSLAAQPLVGDLALHYVYPPYMRRSPQHVSSTTGDISAPAGTKVTIEADLLRPAQVATLAIASSDGSATERIRLQLPSHRRLRGTLTIAAQGHYHFQVADPTGHTLRDPIDHRIEMEPDLPPKVILQGPADYTEVGARQRIELAYAAEDDWGLRRLRLAFQIGSQPPQFADLWRAKPQTHPRQASGAHEWDLATLALEGGGVIAYWIEAEDNDTVGGPKPSTSTVLHLTIFSPDEKHDRTLARQRQLLEAVLRVLGDRLLLFDEASGHSAKERLASATAARTAQRHQAALLDSLAELQRAMRDDALVSDAVLREIDAMYGRIRRLARQAKAVHAPLRTLGHARRASLSAKVMRPLERYNRESIEELERDALLLTSLLDEQRLQKLANASRALKDARARLAELLKKYRENPDPALQRQILDEVARMQRQLARMMRQLAEARGVIPDEYLNAEAMQRIDVGRDLERLQAMLRKGRLNDLDGALAALDAKLGRMQQLIDGNLDTFRHARLSERERRLSVLLDRVSDLEGQQNNLADSTKRLIKRYRERSSQLMRDELADRLQDQKREVEQLQEQLREAREPQLPADNGEQLDRVDRWTAWLHQRLEQRDLVESLDMARKVNDGLKRLQQDMEEDALGDYFPSWREPRQRAHRGIAEAQQRAQKIEEALEDLFPSARSLLSSEEKQRLQNLRARQGRLERQTRRLAAAKDTGKGKSDRVLGQKEHQALRQSARLMRDAAEGLGGSRLQQAEGAQRSAADRLASLREQLQQAHKPRRGSAGASYRDHVKIPGAEAFRPPEAFRQQLLEAMKEEPPSGYENQVKRYYEELVR